MTRIFIALTALLALGICACERHPLPNQTLVTSTHGSDSHHGDYGKDAHAEGDAKHAEGKPDPAKPGAPAAGSEESKPTFFPETK
jgi:hypothetical protein